MTRMMPISDTISVHVPFRFVKRGGRKEMVLPVETTKRHVADQTLVKALARAFRWRSMLESGQFQTLAELAHREEISLSYLSRVLRLTLLAPELIVDILDGQNGPKTKLPRLLEPFPGSWADQLSTLRR